MGVGAETTEQVIAALLFLLYAVNDQWAFRCQRVARGILLLAIDDAAAHQHLFTEMLPGRYVASVWLGRLVLLSTVVLAWRAFGWLGPAAILAYAFVFGAWVDGFSPWPRHSRIVALIQARLKRGKAGLEGRLILPTVERIDHELARGADFEAVTTGVWVSRATAPRTQGARPARESKPRGPHGESTAARIERIASDVHQCLADFITIHDDIFATSLLRSLRRIIPIVGVYRPIPYRQYASKAIVLREEIASSASECADVEHCTVSYEQQAIRVLARYCEAFGLALDGLHAICDGLACQVERQAGPSFSEYNASVAKYEDYRTSSMVLGAELNSALARFRDVSGD